MGCAQQATNPTPWHRGCLLVAVVALIIGTQSGRTTAQTTTSESYMHACMIDVPKGVPALTLQNYDSVGPSGTNHAYAKLTSPHAPLPAPPLLVLRAGTVRATALMASNDSDLNLAIATFFLLLRSQ